MDPRHVKVKFDSSTTPPTWQFKPNPARVTDAGIVFLKRRPKKAAWTFVAVNGLGSAYQYMVVANGSQLIIDDPSPGREKVPYTITVREGDEEYTCPLGPRTRDSAGPPPIIQNDGTTRGPVAPPPSPSRKRRGTKAVAKKSAVKRSRVRKAVARKPGAKKARPRKSA